MISERQFNIDAPVKSTDPEACTQYIVVDPSQYYYIWCINRPMRTLYETINIFDLLGCALPLLPDLHILKIRR